MEKFIRFVIKQLNIRCPDDLHRHWEQALDWFFYFNKVCGYGVPTFEQVRRYL